MDITPKNYQLTFAPDLDNFIFKGKEILIFKTDKKIKKILLDCADLKITECQLLIKGKNVVASVKIDKKHEKLIIDLINELKPGEFKLLIEFEGVLNDKLAGFYRCKYYTPEVFSSSSFTSGVKKKSREKYLATTQFEAADARRAFPCIDQPAYKATFDLSLIIDKHLTAISNTLPKKTVILNEVKDLANEVSVNIKKDASLDSSVASLPQNDKAEKKLIKFVTTPLMSTYLLYLGVGEFEFLEDAYPSEVNDEYKNTSAGKKLRE